MVEKFPSPLGSGPALAAVNPRKVLPREVGSSNILSPLHLAPEPAPGLEEKKRFQFASLPLCLPSDSAKHLTSGKWGVSTCFQLKAHGEGLC